MDLKEYNEKNWINARVDSDVPNICTQVPCILGIDEAGRGPVLGPMVYAVCFCPLSYEEELKNIGLADSKTLNEEKREELFSTIHKNNDNIGWSIEIISPVTICTKMNKRCKVSLNEISHNAAIDLINRVKETNVCVTEVYLDTVGPADKYQAKLQEIFKDVKVTVTPKADSLFPIVSGASICAKVARDRALKSWQFPEEIEVKDWGSGYPADPVTKNFLASSLDPVFGFPGMVRFSWSTADKIISEKCVPVEWEDSEEENDENTSTILKFFIPDVPHKKETYKRKRHFYFSNACLKRVKKL